MTRCITEAEVELPRRALLKRNTRKQSIKCMSRLIESIRLLDGKYCNLFYHEQRMKQSLRVLFGNRKPVNLEKFLLQAQFPEKGLYKCRIVYDDLGRDVTFSPYIARKVNRIKAVE